MPNLTLATFSGYLGSTARKFKWRAERYNSLFYTVLRKTRILPMLHHYGLNYRRVKVTKFIEDIPSITYWGKVAREITEHIARDGTKYITYDDEFYIDAKLPNAVLMVAVLTTPNFPGVLGVVIKHISTLLPAVFVRDSAVKVDTGKTNTSITFSMVIDIKTLSETPEPAFNFDGGKPL